MPLSHFYNRLVGLTPAQRQAVESCTTIDPRTVNNRRAVDRVAHKIAPPETCIYCNGEVHLVSNARFYGKEIGWPLAYVCSCGARVGCHPETSIPLGTLADKATSAARSAAHQAFDPLWRGKGREVRTRAYAALAEAMGAGSPGHISMMTIADCTKLVRVCMAGLKV